MDPSRLDGPGQSGPLTDTSPGSARSPGLKGHPRGSFGRRSSVHTLSFEPNASPFLVLIEDVAPDHLKARCGLQCGGVACEGANGMPRSQRLRYEFPPLRAGGADDEDF